MVTAEAYRAARAALRGAGIEDAAFEADELLRLVTGKGHLQQDAETPLEKEQEQRFQALLSRRCERYPLQYLAGRWPFYGLELAVGEGVLIPRPDTETVVERVLKLLENVPEPRVLDLCAGSGAIGLAVKQMRPDARVTLVERSGAALRYCRENAGQKARVLAADVFGCEHMLQTERFDCVVANPPYVTEAEYARLEPELLFEPREALVAREEGLAFYAYIAPCYQNLLAPGGALVFEIGASQRTAVQAILVRSGYEKIDGERDLGGNDRCVWGYRPVG